LVSVDQTTIAGLPPEQQLEAEEKGLGLKFGSKFYPDSYDFTVSLDKYVLEKRLEIDTLFAYDHLINNIDRNHYKPNVLIRDEKVLVIDHELGFKGLGESTIEKVTIGNPIESRYRHHICYNNLSRSGNKRKQDYFSTFQELLRRSDFNILESYRDQLSKNGIETGNFGEIKSFLEFAKENHESFVNILRSMIV